MVNYGVINAAVVVICDVVGSVAYVLGMLFGIWEVVAFCVVVILMQF